MSSRFKLGPGGTTKGNPSAFVWGWGGEGGTGNANANANVLLLDEVEHVHNRHRAVRCAHAVVREVDPRDMVEHDGRARRERREAPRDERVPPHVRPLHRHPRLLPLHVCPSIVILHGGSRAEVRVALGGEARVAPPAQLFVRPEADVREDAVGAQVGAGGGVGGINGAMGGDVQGEKGWTSTRCVASCIRAPVAVNKLARLFVFC